MNTDHKNKNYSIDGISVDDLAKDFGTPCFLCTPSLLSQEILMK